MIKNSIQILYQTGVFLIKVVFIFDCNVFSKNQNITASKYKYIQVMNYICSSIQLIGKSMIILTPVWRFAGWERMELIYLSRVERFLIGTYIAPHGIDFLWKILFVIKFVFLIWTRRFNECIVPFYSIVRFLNRYS